MRQILIMTCLLAISGYNLASADDSIPERELNEITVVGERGWFEDGILNIIPSKSEKKLSNSPVTLVDAMNIPFLKSREGSIVNMAGEEVKIFINGPEAKDVENAEIVYGTGYLYLSMRLEDMFHDKHRRWTCYDSPNYVSFSNRMVTGRMISLNIAYTFGYGKKVDSSINISGPRTSKTSVMSTPE